mmetsp:Transcript_46365/g.143069  ORF Transcript_46365/g.143069 Transcript_46365/m.143069 type:complete len:218 (-) Transcript_46365:395-1048(-)
MSEAAASSRRWRPVRLLLPLASGVGLGPLQQPMVHVERVDRERRAARSRAKGIRRRRSGGPTTRLRGCLARLHQHAIDPGRLLASARDETLRQPLRALRDGGAQHERVLGRRLELVHVPVDVVLQPRADDGPRLAKGSRDRAGLGSHAAVGLEVGDGRVGGLGGEVAERLLRVGRHRAVEHHRRLGPDVDTVRVVVALPSLRRGRRRRWPAVVRRAV